MTENRQFAPIPFSPPGYPAARFRPVPVLAAAILLLVGASSVARGQGCIPFRGACQQSPATTLGLEHDAGFLSRGEWFLSLNYRYLESDRHYTGDREMTEISDRGQEVVNTQHFVDLVLSYAVTDRLSLSAVIPYVYNVRSSLYEHSELARHTTRSDGLGDIRLTANYWLFDPAANPKGNVSLGLGVKFPTGEYEADDRFLTSRGWVNQAVDPSIQPGDGGYGFSIEASAYRQLVERLAAYAQGFYLFNPQNTNGVPVSRGERTAPDPDDPLAPAVGPETLGFDPGILSGYQPVTSITDQYTARVGLSYLLWPDWGLTASLGGRIDGVPVRDVVGKSDGFRRPGITVSVDPGISVMKHGWTVGLSVPVAVYRNRFRSLEDERISDVTGVGQHGDAAFADYFVSLSVGREF
jgi:hypothetical protein